ncbi:MAG TPA: MFS transporter [Gemmatimonadaceae bacterium]
MTDANALVAPAQRSARSPRLWTSDTRATWAGVGRLVDAHGICQTLMVQLTGGLFLTGLALALGAQELLIGVIAALPLAAKLGQLYLSWRIERAGKWRRTALVSAVIGRAPLLVAAALAVVRPGALTLALFVAALAVAALGASAFELAFLTWTAELIPEPLRGVFWGRRGQIAGAVGIVATLLAAWLLGSDNGSVSSFPRQRLAAVFAAGAIFGLLGILFLRRLPAPRRNESRAEEVPLRATLSRPLRDRSFRQFLAFSSAWSFTAGFMAPFYMVYMLRELRLSFLVVSALTALTNVIMSATQVYWGRLGDHFGTKPVLRIGSYLIVLAPVAWLFTSPAHVWPVIIVQVVSGLGWSAFHVSQGNLALKLSPEHKRPSYLGTFGATSGAAEAIAPIIGGAILALARVSGLGSVATYKAMMLVQLVLFAAATVLPRRIHEPGGHAVGHLIRVMSRFRSMDASEPAKLLFEYGYFHLARLADLIAREYPRDAETL